MHVVVAGRNPATGHEAVEQLRQKAGLTGVELLLADASLVRENVRLAEVVRRRVDSGLYFEGMKERALPAHVMDTTAQDGTWRLAQSLIAKALPESSRTGVR